MRIPEFWRGTPEEVQAQATIAELDGKRARSRRLTPSQKRAYESSSILAKRLSRRRFLFVAGGAGAATASAAVFGVTKLWSQEEQAGEITTPEEASLLTVEAPIESLDTWRALPAKERLNKLWNTKSPEVAGLNPIAETVLASAQFYTENNPSRFTADELVSRTKIIETNSQYVDIMLANGNLDFANMTREEVEETILLYGSSGFTSELNNEVFLSKAGIEKSVQEGLQASPEFAQEAEKSDVTLKMISYSLLHEYGHVNEDTQRRTLQKPVNSIIDPSVNVIAMVGLNIEMDQVFNPGQVTILPADEFLIDTRAFQLCEDAGNNIVLYINNSYAFARIQVEELNRAANISGDELAKYITGELSILNLLQRWGSVVSLVDDSDEQKFERAVNVYTILGANASQNKLVPDDLAADMIEIAKTVREQKIPLVVPTP